VPWAGPTRCLHRPRTFFSQFWNGLLAGYDYLPLGALRTASADDLQGALWFLEDDFQGGAGGTFMGHNGFNNLSARAKGWVTDAYTQTAAGGTWFTQFGNSIGNVRVLNLTSLLPGQVGIARQDVLVLTGQPVTTIPLPPAAVMGLGLMSMIGAGFYVKRRRAMTTA